MQSHSTITTEPDKGLSKGRAKWNTSQAKVRDLVERILVDEDNDQALALIALVELLAFERKSFVDRETLAGMAANHAYTQTLAFGAQATAFRDRAMRLITPTSVQVLEFGK